MLQHVSFVLSCIDSDYPKPRYDEHNEMVNLGEISEAYYIYFETEIDSNKTSSFVKNVSDIDVLTHVLKNYDNTLLELENSGLVFDNFFDMFSHVYFYTLVNEYDIDTDDFELKEEVFHYVDELVYYNPVPDNLEFSHIHKVFVTESDTQLKVLYKEELL